MDPSAILALSGISQLAAAVPGRGWSQRILYKPKVP
jgi:hypothetical protein